MPHAKNFCHTQEPLLPYEKTSTAKKAGSNMKYINRPEYEQRLKDLRNTNDIKVITGVRRCGKSSLLQWLSNDLIKNGVQKSNLFYKRMDMFGMPVNPDADWLMSQLTKKIENSDKKSPFYVLIDEIQDVKGWERVIRQMHTRPNTDVYLTGSNAYILSSDIATLIGGRYTEVKIQPLSFKEYLNFAAAAKAPFNSNDAAFAKYLKYGAMPALFDLKEEGQEAIAQFLKTVYETVILNDVATRTRIDDLDLLSKLVRYVFSTSGNLFSANKIANTLTSYGRKTRVETVSAYLKALKDALILYECEQEGLAGKEILRPRCKYYPVDTGLRNLMCGFKAENIGYQLENVVHNELLHRGWNINVGTLKSSEVDFVTTRADKKLYIQVTETMLDEKVKARELAPLQSLENSWPKLVLTTDVLGCGKTDSGVEIKNIMDWLLEN